MNNEIEKLRKLYNAKKYNQCLIEAQKFTVKFGKHSLVLSLIAELHLKNSDYKKALIIQRKAVINSKRNIKYLNLLAEIYYKNKNSQRAINILIKSIKVKIADINTWILLGEILLEKKRFDQSLTCFKEALKIDINNKISITNISSIYIYTKNYDQAIFFIEKQFNKNENILNNLGVAYYKKRNYLKSKITFTDALQMYPNNSSMNNNMANTLLELGLIKESIIFRKKAILLNPSNIDTKWNLYLNFYYDNDKLSCQKVLNEIFDLNTNNLTINYKIYVTRLIENFLSWTPLCPQLGFDKNISKEKTKDFNEIKNYLIYEQYLMRLTNQLINESPEKYNIMYAIGESHILSLNNKIFNIAEDYYKCTSHLIFGLKMWHLAQNPHNKYKHLFKNILQNIPHKSIILLVAGEIDCRINEGVLKEFNKNKIELSDIIVDTVNNYFKFILLNKLNSNYKLIIQGVPAISNIRNKYDYQTLLLKHIIYLFNKTLYTKCKEYNISFLDIYELTSHNYNEENECHIDGTHLKSEVYNLAFKDYLR